MEFLLHNGYAQIARSSDVKSFVQAVPEDPVVFNKYNSALRNQIQLWKGDRQVRDDWLDSLHLHRKKYPGNNPLPVYPPSVLLQGPGVPPDVSSLCNIWNLQLSKTDLFVVLQFPFNERTSSLTKIQGQQESTSIADDLRTAGFKEPRPKQRPTPTPNTKANGDRVSSTSATGEHFSPDPASVDIRMRSHTPNTAKQLADPKVGVLSIMHLEFLHTTTQDFAGAQNG
jgi:hypothetical protein